MDCPVCLEIYLKPKILSCGHTICLNCVVKLLKFNFEDKKKFKCPMCKCDTIYINDNFMLEESINCIISTLNIENKMVINDINLLENDLNTFISKNKCLYDMMNFLFELKTGNSPYIYGF